MNASGRNEPCPCGSGKKYKKCCLPAEEAAAQQTRPPASPAAGEDHWIAELRPEVEDAVDRVLVRLDRGQHENVQADLEALLREHPDYHRTNFALGTFRAKVLKDLEGALPLLQKAVRLLPPMAEAHYNLGSCYMQLTRLARAVDCFRNAIRYSGSDVQVADKARGQLEDLERIVTETSDLPTLEACIERERRFDHAFQELRAERFQAAVDGFSQILAKTPRHVQSHGNIALAYAGLGKRALALEHLDKALALDSTYGPAISNRKVVAALKEGEPGPPFIVQEVEYYRERLEAEKSPARL